MSHHHSLLWVTQCVTEEMPGPCVLSGNRGFVLDVRWSSGIMARHLGLIL